MQIFPRVTEIAAELGTTRMSLWRALTGRVKRPDVVAAYYSRVAPGFVQAIALADLPAGTRLVTANAKAAKALLPRIPNATRKGRTLTLTEPLSLCPALAAPPPPRE